MPPRRRHPAKGWAGALDRTSLVRTDIAQDSSENQQRLNRETARAYGLELRPGYDFSERGTPASKPITRRELERGINAVVSEQAIEALLVSSVDRLSRLGMRHVGEMLDAVDAVGGRIIGRLSPPPDEAPVVRRIVTWFLEGQPARQIAMALNEAGVLAPAAAKAAQIRAEGRVPTKGMSTWWSTQAVTRLLRSPVLVGWARHNGRIVLGPDGEPVNFGEGILTPGEHARVLMELERRTAIVRHSPTKTREVGRRTGGGRPARYLLVGMARCGGCTYAMSVGGIRSDDGGGLYYDCGGAGGGRACPAAASIKVETADAEVMRQLRIRLAAMEPNDPILGVIAERWRELTMPEGEGERALLQSRLDAVRGRIVDLEEARYVRGEFASADDVARWDGMMSRLKVQRDAVLQEIEELGPPPDFDLTTLRASYSDRVWDATPLPQRRKWLQVAVAKVLVSSARRRKLPAADRVRVILVGEEPESAG
jgi:site-specific DNA recombinase